MNMNNTHTHTLTQTNKNIFSATAYFPFFFCFCFKILFCLFLLFKPSNEMFTKNVQKLSTIIIRNHDVLDATMWFPVFQCFNTSLIYSPMYTYMTSLLWIVSTRTMCYIDILKGLSLNNNLKVRFLSNSSVFCHLGGCLSVHMLST